MAVNFRYFFKESASSMRRNMALTIAAIMVTALSLILLGAVGMLVHAGNGLADERQAAGRRDPRLPQGRDHGRGAAEPRHLHQEDARGPKSVTYISKEQALKDFQEMYKDQQVMLEEIEGNPLPAEFKVRMKDPKYNTGGRQEARNAGRRSALTPTRARRRSSSPRTW